MTIYCFRHINGKLGFYDPDTKRAVFENSKIREINEPRLGASTTPKLEDYLKGINKAFEMTIINSPGGKTKVHDSSWYKFQKSPMSKEQFNDLYEAAVHADSCRENYLSSLTKLEEIEGVLFKSNLESSL